MPRVATSTLHSASTAQSWNDRRRAAEFTELDPAVVDLRAGPLKAKVNLPGIKKLLLPRPADTASLDTSVPARALFGPPPETAVAEKRSSLVDFLKQVTLFEDLSRRDLRRLARIVHERDYRDGEYVFEEGKPGAALFVLRRGVVEVVKRGSSGTEVPLAILEPPACFEESAAMGTEAVRWFSATGAWPRRVAGSREIRPGRAQCQLPAAGEQSSHEVGRHYGHPPPDAPRRSVPQGVRGASGDRSVTHADTSSRAETVFKPLAAAAGVVLGAYLVWGLRSLIVPVAVGGRVPYIW